MGGWSVTIIVTASAMASLPTAITRIACIVHSVVLPLEWDLRPPAKRSARDEINCSHSRCGSLRLANPHDSRASGHHRGPMTGKMGA